MNTGAETNSLQYPLLIAGQKEQKLLFLSLSIPEEASLTEDKIRFNN